MNECGDDSTKFTWQQLLAAYVDGELDEGVCRQVEKRLRDDPGFVSELESQRRFSRANESFWQAVQPPQPSEQRWDSVYNRLEQRLRPTAEPARSPRNRAGLRWLRRGLFAALLAVPAATTAAAVLLAVLGQQAPNGTVDVARDDDASEVFTITQPHDVEIVKMQHADSEHLVVGEPPLREPVTLASASDVQLDGLQPARDGMMPEADMSGGGTPMIYPPLPRPK